MRKKLSLLWAVLRDDPVMYKMRTRGGDIQPIGKDSKPLIQDCHINDTCIFDAEGRAFVRGKHADKLSMTPPCVTREIDRTYL